VLVYLVLRHTTGMTLLKVKLATVQEMPLSNLGEFLHILMLIGFIFRHLQTTNVISRIFEKG